MNTSKIVRKGWFSSFIEKTFDNDTVRKRNYIIRKGELVLPVAQVSNNIYKAIENNYTVVEAWSFPGKDIVQVQYDNWFIVRLPAPARLPREGVIVTMFSVNIHSLEYDDEHEEYHNV